MLTDSGITHESSLPGVGGSLDFTMFLQRQRRGKHVNTVFLGGSRAL